MSITTILSTNTQLKNENMMNIIFMMLFNVNQSSSEWSLFGRASENRTEKYNPYQMSLLLLDILVSFSYLFWFHGFFYYCNLFFTYTKSF